MKIKKKILFPNINYTTDNAAMIALVGYLKYKNSHLGNLKQKALSNYKIWAMNLFFDPNLNADSSEVFTDKSEIKHIEKVLRKKKGDFLNFTNGKGLEAIVEICTKQNDLCFKVRDIIHHTIKDQSTHIAL